MYFNFLFQKSKCIATITTFGSLTKRYKIKMQKPQNPFTQSTTKLQASRLSWSMLIGFCVMLLILGSCHKGITIRKPDDFFKYSPPGTAEIKSNFYYDITETANIDWLEYLYWTQQVFGNNSKEHKATLTDTLACQDGNFYCLCNFKEKYTYKKDTHTTWESLVENYFRHPKYADYPVIGVS